MPRSQISCCDASGPAPSAPISLTPISRLCGNLPRRRQVRLSSRQSSQPQLAMQLRRVPIVRQQSQLALEVSPFSLAERTAFVGRETELSAIRPTIDRARPATDRCSCSLTVPAWARPGWRWRWRSMLRARAFDAPSGAATKETAPFPFYPSPRLLKAIWPKRRASMTITRQMGPNAAELAQIAPSLRRVFPDIPQPLELPPAQQRRYLFQSFSEALAPRGSNPAVHLPA